MKKIFGKINLTWKKVILAAVIIGPVIGILNSILALRNTSFADPAIYFAFWILCGILIIMNSKSNMDSALKCFVFFLISQPLIYLVEVPFEPLHWQVFVYYKPWFIWTLFCLPMGFIGYYMKKDKWWGYLILLPMIGFLFHELTAYISGAIFAFPKHTLSIIFTAGSMIVYPLFIFNNKKIRITGLVISILAIIAAIILSFIERPVYETEFICSDGSRKVTVNENTKVTLKDSKYGELSVKKIDETAYCIHAKFYKEGKTVLTVENEGIPPRVFDLTIKRYSYNLEEKEATE